MWGNSISEEYFTSVFNGDPENRGLMFVRKVGTYHLSDNIVL
jgi:hypothetical protein